MSTELPEVLLDPKWKVFSNKPITIITGDKDSTYWKPFMDAMRDNTAQTINVCHFKVDGSDTEFCGSFKSVGSQKVGRDYDRDRFVCEVKIGSKLKKPNSNQLLIKEPE